MTGGGVAEANIDIVEANEFILPPRPFIWQDYVQEVFFACLLLLAVGLVAWIIRWRLQRGSTPKERALKALSEAWNLWPQRSPLWFTLRCNRILRDFFQGLYSIKAAALTSWELLEAVTKLGVLTAEQRAWMEAYLRQCDNIRFAGGMASQEVLEATYKSIIAFIEAIYNQQREKPAIVEEPEPPSPFLPGTPMPVLSVETSSDFLKAEVKRKTNALE